MKIVKNKLRKLNRVFSIFNLQVKKGSFFDRPSTIELKGFNYRKLVCIEVGVNKGVNALSILENLDVEKLFLIDPYKKYVENAKGYSQGREMGKKVFLIAKNKLKDFKDRIKFIKMSSKDAVKLFQDNSIDFIYIDANHDYKFVKEDIKLYYPKLRKFGIIAGHDIEFEGVFKAVSEFCVENKLRGIVNGCDWIIKKGLEKE